MDTIKLHAQCLLIAHAMSDIEREIAQADLKGTFGTIYLDKLDDIINGLHIVARKIGGIWRTGSDDTSSIQPWLRGTMRRIHGLTEVLYEYSQERGDEYEPALMCAWYMLGELLES